MGIMTESTVEQAALAWLSELGWQVKHGPDIAPGMPAAERQSYGEVVLAQRLRDALARLNPALPADALEEAFRRLTRPEGADLLQRNRALHRLFIEGIPVQYLQPSPRPDGSPSPSGRGDGGEGPLSQRSNIVVITDEAHRSQYDFIDGFARHMRDALPRAAIS